MMVSERRDVTGRTFRHHVVAVAYRTRMSWNHTAFQEDPLPPSGHLYLCVHKCVCVGTRVCAADQSRDLSGIFLHTPFNNTVATQSASERRT